MGFETFQDESNYVSQEQEQEQANLRSKQRKIGRKAIIARKAKF